VLDVQVAPQRLRTRLESEESAERRTVLERALVLAERIVADAASLEAFRAWLRATSDGSVAHPFEELLESVGEDSGINWGDAIGMYVRILGTERPHASEPPRS